MFSKLCLHIIKTPVFKTVYLSVCPGLFSKRLNRLWRDFHRQVEDFTRSGLGYLLFRKFLVIIPFGLMTTEFYFYSKGQCRSIQLPLPAPLCMPMTCLLNIEKRYFIFDCFLELNFIVWISKILSLLQNKVRVS